MISVRAKFRVELKTQSETGYAVTLAPVTGGSAENDDFYKYTPSGSIQLNTINEGAATHFVVGEEYYVDFSRAETGLD